ncbi:cysteine-tryptophan domain-containing zinc finger protein 3 isoform X3 [Gossypium arboreum]|uniref:cysteine-tryptophan domain-containing zinc finger protein 3 isoform X2 n=1 Tax=Gossypium arboreum TaxID=29729 RepID=UPI000819116A|nr:cysteine-tryptophan domain-containing zinc finger protein 3 isoform X2 [Gossypium arboreum]XP_052877461.1 cysteine-tryptophan domain-containing zinc finger protein 3 isoform X2 [Gossypium arboreum]XP_052877462.1 cysteine-tryptophan domain-containing zinc finger protein 3 isoform X2 [Gossypium arboreum]XP_052877463.1 cysteine-tryptophan domain-containing zinc finger protein 3 isoform X3 [Gossypium arboreum]
MEEAELEEGEACSYSNNNDDYDAENDLSSLSYIDEKIQHVLGHFQKDFEGGVSAENLGAKFGGYGSFLPTYTRSPSWPHPKSPPKVQSSDAPRSLNNMSLEDGRHNLAYRVSGSESLRPGLPLSNFGTLLALKASSVNDSIQQEVSLTSTHDDELASKCDFASNNAANLPDLKTLKVRIKVGSDNLTEKSAAIYSGLGLDISPSSSLEESPSESEGMYRQTQDQIIFESPTSILQSMTSFPVPGDTLLSPLPDHLLNLIVKKKIPEGNKSDAGKDDGTLFVDNKAKSLEKKDFPVERKSSSSRETRIKNGLMLKKEVDIVDTLACEELVSKTLKLPLLSNSYSSVDKVKSKGMTRKKGVHDVAMEDSPGPILSQEIEWENPRAGSARKVLEEQKTSVLDGIPGYARKHGYDKADKTCDSVKADSNTVKGGKALNSESVDPPKQKICLGATSHKQDNMKLPPTKEHTSSGGKRKPTGSQGHGSLTTEVQKESSRVDSSSIMKHKQTVNLNNYTNKRESGNEKLERPFQKAEDRYRDIFGDIGESEQEENQTSSLEIHSEDQLKEAHETEKNTSSINSAHNDRLSGKKTEYLLATKSYTRTTVDFASNSANASVAGTSLATAAPTLIIENWVRCDKCQKWRLLPININPADLPEKWLCSMLDWLPAMNRCNVDEDETTKAVLALYNVPAVESRTNLQSNSGNIMSRLPSANALQPEQNQQSFGSRVMPPAGRKKDSLKEISNAMLTPMKKNMQSSIQSGSLNGVIQFPVVGESGLQHPSQCDLPVKKHKNKSKEKHKLVEHSSDGGDARTSNMKGKRTTEQDSLRASKKIKVESSRLADEDWMFEHAGKSTSNGLPNTSVGKDQPKNSEGSSYKDSSDKDRQQVSGKRPKNKVGVPLTDGSLDLANCDGGAVSRKREVDDCINSQLFTDSFQSMGNYLQENRVFVKEEFCENDYRREKKARASKSGGKDSSASKSSGTLEKKGRHTKNRQSGQDLGSPRRRSDGEDNGGSERSGTIRKEKTSAAVQQGYLESSVLDIQDKDVDQLGVSKAKAPIESSHDIRKGEFINASVDYLRQEVQCAGKSIIMDERHNEESQNDNRGNPNVSYPRKSGKGLSQSKDRNRNFKSGSADEQPDCAPCEVKSMDGRNKFQEWPGVKSNESVNRLDDDKEALRKLSGESSKRENYSSVGQSDAKPDASGGQDLMSTMKQNLLQESNSEGYTKSFHSEKYDRAEIASGRGNSLSLPPAGGTQNEMLTGRPRPVSGSQKGNRADRPQADDALKVQKQVKKADHQNGTQHSSSRNTSGGCRIRDVDAPSPMRKDSSSQAATNALKEAKDLKHLADRLKNSGSNVESTALYFQAALKFLHSASLLESCNSESNKHGDMIQSMQMYSSTAKLCEFCAHEYERLKDMAAASLAYKCMEVAYMRVIYSSHANASRDRRELQTALQMVPPGESPSSSASDVDNLNHPTTADKVAFPKGLSSPQVAGNHVISARNRPNFVRLLNFAQDVNHAMEASRKSRSTFAAANFSSGGAESGEAITSVKKALDYNFQDVEGVLRLVRVAMEALNH